VSDTLLRSLDDALLAKPGWIFDCDGTLAASMRLHHRSWTHAIERQTGRPFDFEWALFCSMGGMSTEATCERLRERHGLALDPRVIREHTNDYLEIHLEAGVEARAHVVAVLHHVRRAGARTAVASGGTRDHVGRTLRRLALEPHFEAVVTCEDVARQKPEPDIFLEAARRIGRAPSDCVVVEDSPRGREAALAAGMACVMVEPA